jgi:predicted DNA repair protein MutK
MLQGIKGTVHGLGWELCFKLIFLVPFALLMGIPFLPLIVIVGGLYLFFKLVMASISSTIDSAKSQKDSEQRSDKDSQGNSHE